MNNRRSNGKQRDNAFRRVMLVIVVIFILIFVLIAVRSFLAGATGGGGSGTDEAGSSGSGQSDQADSISAVAETEKINIFPYVLEDGSLTVETLFQSSVENPDCNNEIGEDIATLEIINTSDTFCASADITAILQDGTEIVFRAENIPAGRKIWAFATDNQSLGQGFVCEDIQGTADLMEASMMEDQISVSVEDTTITVQNITDSELTNLQVGYHCLFDDVYFGGTTYVASVETIGAGESVTIDADECYMGTAEVVYITQGN